MRLRTIREAFGISQIDLARRACVSRFRLYEAECGSIELRPEEVEAIERVLKPAAARAVEAAVALVGCA